MLNFIERTNKQLLLIFERKRANFYFLIVIVVKLVSLGIFDSDLTTLLFRPFIDGFLSGHLNPWQFFYENGLSQDAFPYHGLMLGLHVIPALIGKWFISIGFIYNLLFKAPIFLGDLLLYHTLVKMFPSSKRAILIFYFLNPIVFYAIYVHSQLDIIPTALLVSSIYYLTKGRIGLSAFILGCALATKFHVLVVIPLLIMFVYKTSSLKNSIIYSVIPFLILLLFDLPFIRSEGFLKMVIFNPKQSLLFDSFHEVGTLRIYLPILSIFFIYFHFFFQRKVNTDLLNFYLAALYIVLLFFIYPAPGWYIWLVPFITVYFLRINSKKRLYLLYGSFSLLYLVFFVFFYKGEYTNIYLMNSRVNMDIKNSDLSSMVYTVLEGILVIILYLLYKHGFKSNSVYNRVRNLTLGIGGDSGVGKTTFVNNLSLLLGDRLLKLEGDGEHKWERGDKNWSRYTHLDPKANNIHQQAQAIFNLKNDKAIYRSEYDHATGKFSEPFMVVPKDFIAISGLHPFYLPKLRKTIDLKIYMDTDEKLRQHWKIIRDTKHRGYSLEKIMSQIEARAKDSEKYIHPQKNFSDLTIKLFPENEFELGSASADINLCLKVTLDASFHLEEVIDYLDCPLLWDYNEDLVTQYLIFKEEPKVDFKKLAHKTILNFTEILDDKSEFLEGYDGFIQYLTLMLISEKLKEDR